MNSETKSPYKVINHQVLPFKSHNLFLKLQQTAPFIFQTQPLLSYYNIFYIILGKPLKRNKFHNLQKNTILFSCHEEKEVSGLHLSGAHHLAAPSPTGCSGILQWSENMTLEMWLLSTNFRICGRGKEHYYALETFPGVYILVLYNTIYL